MKLLKKIKKLTFLEVVFISLLGILLWQCLFKSNKEGFVEIKKEFIKKSGPDIYDDFYVSVYDKLVHNNNRVGYEINTILEDSSPHANILDVGSGTGHHVNFLNKNNNTVIGIDNSPAMIKIAKRNYPKLNFKLGDILTSSEFAPESFTHISCLYFTIYYIKDKKQFFENCFNWLQPNGVLVLHLVNIHKFDPVIPIADPFIIVSPQTYAPKRITESIVNFDVLDYKSDFELDSTINANTVIQPNSNAIFKEVFKFKDKKKTRINEHKLYMSTQKNILALARDVGFILKSQKEMIDIQYENNYLYTLEKPS